MKIVITGHTSGIGKALYDLMTEQGHTVVGLSRSNGFDLSKNIDMFLLKDWDIYINNAQYEFKQTELLYKLFEENKNRDCQIINIGSVSSDNAGYRDYVNEYSVYKTALETACSQLQFCDPDCKIILIKPGRTDTPLVAERVTYKIDPQYMAECIMWVMYQPKRILVKSITIDSMHSRRVET